MGICPVIGVSSEAGEQVNIGHGERLLQLFYQKGVVHGGIPSGQIIMLIGNYAVVAVHLGIFQVGFLNVENHTGQMGDRCFVQGFLQLDSAAIAEVDPVVFHL